MTGVGVLFTIANIPLFLIEPKVYSVYYISFDEIFETTGSLERGTYFGNIDVKSALRLLRTHPSNHQFLFFKYGHRFYNDMCLPMGCFISSALWGNFSHIAQ